MSRVARFAGARGVLRLGAALALAAALASPASAQQSDRTRERSPREQVLDRLRALSVPDSLRGDSLATDTLRVTVPVGGAMAPRAEAPVQPIMPRDSLVESLLGLDGFIATEYEGSGARFASDSGRIELTGKATVLRDGQNMSADSMLVYDMDGAKICGYGNPTMSGSGAAPVSSEQVCYDIENRMGVAHGARTEFNQGATWYVTGTETYFVGNDRLYSHDAIFTDCDLEEPHYHFKAGEVKMVRDNIMVARNVTLNFKDVPVFWLPFVMQSMKQGRRSGLLMPDFSVNDIASASSGYKRDISNIGFYWAISDNLGLKLAGGWREDDYTSLNSTFEYRWLRQFLEGTLNVNRFMMQDGGTELTMTTQNRWQPGERTSVSASGQYTSSSNFVRRNTFDPRELNRSINSNVSLNHRFDWGSMSLGGERRQYLSDDRVEMTLPSASLTLQPVTLFSAPQTQASWYNNATWTGSANASATSSDLDDAQAGVQFRDSRGMRGSLTSSLNLGNLQWSQNFETNEQIDLAKAAVEEDTALARESTQRMAWSTSLNYQQRLVGTSTFTPGLTMRGGAARSPAVGNQMVTSPLRLDFGASLRTDLYGFWPGVGAFSRIRHKISPGINYTYSPEAKADSLQRVALGASDALEQNRFSISLNQTFEAKRASSETEGADSVGVEETEGRPGEPRRRPQAEKMTLLSLNTSAVAYDFVKAREDTTGMDLPGWVNPTLSNTISSDLLRGLSLQVGHDLFETPRDAEGTALPRKFSPHLSTVSASFSIGSNSGLVKALGFGRKAEEAKPSQAAAGQDTTSAGAGAAEMGQDVGQGVFGGGGNRYGGAQPMGSVGSWDAQLSYSLQRPRGTGLGGAELENNQMVTGSLSMQPTDKWRLSWRTAYSLTESEFSDHMLTLTRDMHEWQANFDFFKTQNGNFSFQFRVNLKSTPDLKVEYDQRGRGNGTGLGGAPIDRVQ